MHLNLSMNVGPWQGMDGWPKHLDPVVSCYASDSFKVQVEVLDTLGTSAIGITLYVYWFQ